MVHFSINHTAICDAITNIDVNPLPVTWQFSKVLSIFMHFFETLPLCNDLKTKIDKCMICVILNECVAHGLIYTLSNCMRQEQMQLEISCTTHLKLR